ncbi:hypothetical protein FACS1894158_07130 [Betaproteobacteria bacterium]|nr:hypothetical protein FACS1894158_07130 [Betaproteobacteria bacterium]
MNKTLTPTPNSLPANVIAALQDGEKIKAIQLLREATGLSLKEAKDAVESVYIEPQGRAPARIKPQRRATGAVPKSGKTDWLIALLFIAGLVVYYFLQAAD